ncbi:MAG: ABC transporter substrate-binding protein [Planctomycetota bacterium]
MNVLKIILLAVIALALLIQALIGFNQPERQKQISDALDELKQGTDRLRRSLDQPTPDADLLAELAALRAAIKADARDPELAAALDDLRAELGQLRARLAAGAVVEPPAQAPVEDEPDADGPADDETDPAASDVADQVDDEAEPLRDGLPRLEANFLLPHAEPQFDPAHVGGTLRSFGTTPPGLNPITENASNVSALHATVNDPLCERDSVEPARWRSMLATSCVISDDYKVYTFTIRPGVYWQVPRIAYAEAEQFGWLRERRELTAADFVFAIEMIKHPDVQCPALKAYYEDLEGAEAVDDHTLRLVWKEKIYTSLASSMGMEPLPRHVYTCDQDGEPLPEENIGLQFNDHWFDQRRQVIGVGQYQLWDYEPDKEIVFRRYDERWAPSDHFTTVTQNCAIRDDSAQLTKFKNGEVHIHGLTPIQYKSNIIDGHETRFDPDNGRAGELGWERVDRLAYYYIGWNMRRPLFADRTVRQALAHAFPKRRIIEQVFFGIGEPAVTPVHPQTPYFNDAIEDYSYDTNRAQELLFEAGWSDSDGDGLLDKMIDGEREQFSFTVKGFANSPDWDRALAIYQAELRKLGIAMETVTLEWKDLVRVYESRDFDAMVGGWRMSYEVDFEQLWHSRFADEPRSSNHVGFKDPRADELAERLRRTFDVEERKRIAREFQAIIHAEAPYLFFRTGEAIFTWQNAGPDKVHGVVEAFDTLHPFFSRDRSWYYFGE